MARTGSPEEASLSNEMTQLPGALRRHSPWPGLMSTLLALAAFACLGAAANAAEFKVVGSTTFAHDIMDVYQSAIERATGQKLLVVPNKSIPGLVTLLERRADLAMVSAPLEQALPVLRKTVPELPIEQLKEFAVTEVPLALPLHPANPVRTTTSDMLRRVLLGELTNWRDLGGPDVPIRVVLVATGDEIIVANKFFGKPQIPLKDVIRVHTPAQLVEVVEQEPGALGFTQQKIVQAHHLPILALDHPLEQPLNYITLGEPTPTVLAVIEATRRLVRSKGNEASHAH